MSSKEQLRGPYEFGLSLGCLRDIKRKMLSKRVGMWVWRESGLRLKAP